MKDKELKVKWSKKEDDFLIIYPRSPDGGLINDYLFNNQFWFNGDIKKSLKEELKERGYDLKTLKFSIKMTPNKEKEK